MPSVALPSPERHHVPRLIATHEHPGAVLLQVLDRLVARVPVAGEPILPDIAGALGIDHLENPVLLVLAPVNLDVEPQTADHHQLALARVHNVGRVVGHMGS
jgi:hypothetical protein